MLAAATSFFARTAISQSYNIGTSSTSGSRSSTPGPGGSSPPSAPVAHAPPVQIGLWKVQSAVHKVTNKRVSVWSFDKRGAEVERISPVARDRVLEVLKAEVLTFDLRYDSTDLDVIRAGFCPGQAATPFYPR